MAGKAAAAAVDTGFSGSYAPEDVTFLLKPVGAEAYHQRSAEEKERLIQTGAMHYSEMIAREAPPSPEYLAVFDTALARHGARMARETAALAVSLNAALPGPITLASLVRAGVPLGVLLTRALRALGRDVAHFGISIIRDRGLDLTALQAIRAARPPAGLVFVDGWTGKGAIAGELEGDLATRAPEIAPRLVALADPCGRAWLSASHDDWLIPSGILGGIVSGLVSRTILNDRLVAPGEFHATVRADHLAGWDRSRSFVDALTPPMLAALAQAAPSSAGPTAQEAKRQDAREAARAKARAAAAETIDRVAARFDIANRNRIKPGIAEATRAVLRRAPERVLIRGTGDPDLAGLETLASERGILLEVDPALVAPYRAITVIRAMAGRAGGR
ncbi:MAG: cysteine protease StiP domain-containing protein [Pseudomonadota bacterium]